MLRSVQGEQGSGALETGGVRVASMAAALLAALAAVSYLQALEGIRRAAQLVA